VIRKLRIKFIASAMLTLALAMLIVFGGMLVLLSNRINAQYGVLLDWIVDKRGEMPENFEMFEGKDRELFGELPELLNETRLFTATLDGAGRVSSVDVSRVSGITEEDAGSLAKEVSQDKSSGHLRDDGRVYIYKWDWIEDGGIFACFIDISSRLWMVYQLRDYSMIVAGIMMLLYFLLYSRYSKVIVEPYIKAQEQQKRFITNASHELKTPLTVISANTELLESINGENKWTRSTANQVQRMNSLISSLVTLSRVDEQGVGELVEVDFSAAAREEGENFRDVITSQGMSFSSEVADGIKVKANDMMLHQLVSILLDNAAKYCDEGGSVTLSLSSQGKNARLAVSNSYAAGENVDYSRFFERFYRADESHSSGKSGFGIGLSIASQMTELFKGKINASHRDGMISFTVELPLS